MRKDVGDHIIQPGEIIVANTEIEINKGRPSTALEVKNVGDRPIQVGSHFHFFEVNNSLQFEREKAYGKKLDIPAGAAVRFEPGDKKMVQLVEYGGKRRIYGFRGEVNGPIDENRVYKPTIQDIVDDNEGLLNINKKEGYKQIPKENLDSVEKKQKLEEMRKERESRSVTHIKEDKGGDSK